MWPCTLGVSGCTAWTGSRSSCLWCNASGAIMDRANAPALRPARGAGIALAWPTASVATPNAMAGSREVLGAAKADANLACATRCCAVGSMTAGCHREARRLRVLRNYAPRSQRCLWTAPNRTVAVAVGNGAAPDSGPTCVGRVSRYKNCRIPNFVKWHCTLSTPTQLNRPFCAAASLQDKRGFSTMACAVHPHLSHVVFGACVSPATVSAALLATGTSHRFAGFTIHALGSGQSGAITPLLNCSLSCAYPYIPHGGVPWAACGRQADGPAHWLAPPAVPPPLQCHLQWDWQIACVGAVAAVFALCLLAVTIQECRTPYNARVDRRNKWKLDQLGWTVVSGVASQ